MSLRHPRGDRYNALTNTVGGALAWWDGRHEENDKRHNKTLTSMVVGVQCLFIERVNEWTRAMAPWGWKRQTRWAHRGWMGLIFGAFRQHTVGRRDKRHARRRALRRIGAVLVSLSRDEECRRVGEQRKQEREQRRRAARRRVRSILWGLYIRGETRAQQGVA